MGTLHKSGGGQEQELVNLGGFWKRSVINEYGMGFSLLLLVLLHSPAGCHTVLSTLRLGYVRSQM